MLSSLLKSQAIQLTKNDKFSKIIEQIPYAKHFFCFFIIPNYKEKRYPKS